MLPGYVLFPFQWDRGLCHLEDIPPAEFRGKGGPDLACITSGHLAGCDYRHPDLSSYVHQVQEDHLTFVKEIGLSFFRMQ